MSRDGQNVVPRLGRQIAVAGEPVRNTGRTGIVGGGGQSKIAETLLEVGEKFGGFWDCFFGIERIGKATLISRFRHELRDALRADWTDRVGSKAAFLPYQRQADVSIDSTLPVAALSDPASAELPQNRASKPKDRRVDRSSIEMS
jgi:hypothetical protein